MSALPDYGPRTPQPPALDPAAGVDEHYLISHGKNGGVGSFAARLPATLCRGDRVIVDSARGREVGTVLCPANLPQPRMLGAIASGRVIRPLLPADQAMLLQMRQTEEHLFDAGRRLALAQALSLEVLDAEVLLDERAIVQFLGEEDLPLEGFALTLGRSFGLDIRMENLGLPARAADHDHGCGKPDCGKTAGGGCTTCGSGGCSSCGTGATDLRPYFAHLRTQMEARERTSLL